MKSKKILQIAADKEHHPCWHSWEECLAPARRMTALMESFVPDIFHLRHNLEDTIRYACLLEEKLAWAYEILRDHHLQEHEETLDEIRALLAERVPPPEEDAFSEREDSDPDLVG
jgi:hypothetical protein